MVPILYLFAAAMVFVLLTLAIKYKNDSEKSRPGRGERPPPRPRQADNVPVRRRNVMSRIQQRAEEAQSLDQESDDEDHIHKKDGKIGTKKLKKLQEKEERKKLREMEMRAREERKKEQDEKDQRRQIEEEKRLQEELKKAEEKQMEQEKKAKREHEEYVKLKAMFSVEEEGQRDIDSDDESHNMLLQFVEFIKSRKVVLLEDLASNFGLRTQDAIDRIQTMLNDEILSGVIDDRGKFIYISNDELTAVAKFVKQRGRISISDLAQASNSLVTLISEGPAGQA